MPRPLTPPLLSHAIATGAVIGEFHWHHRTSEFLGRMRSQLGYQLRYGQKRL